MSNIYEFPNNSQNYYKKAINELSHHQLDQAIDSLKKSIEKEKNIDAFEELVTIYSNLKDSNSLIELWENFDLNNDNIYMNQQLVDLYSLSLPNMYSVDKALLLLHEHLRKITKLNFNQHFTNEILDNLSTLYHFSQQINEANNSGKIKELSNFIVDHGPSKTIEYIEMMNQLPIDCCLSLYKELLIHPMVINYIKSMILTHLINLKVDYNLKLTWFKEDKSVSLNELMLYNDMSSYQVLLNEISSYCQQYNPHLESEIINQFKLYYLSFYPFIEKVTSSSNEWLDAFLQTINGSDYTSHSNQVKHYMSLATKDIIKLISDTE